MYKLVLIRHGESEWNKENRFTGWKDVDLTEKGLQEAKTAGQLLKAEGFLGRLKDFCGIFSRREPVFDGPCMRRGGIAFAYFFPRIDA